MDHKRGNNHFHDSESVDVYDLYNACNGTLHNGILDIRKLDDLSKEEREVLDVPRLREVWNHVASGCAECIGIVNTLNFARSAMSAPAAESRHEAANSVSAEYAESGSQHSK